MPTRKEEIVHICEKTGIVYSASYVEVQKGCNFCSHWKLALARTDKYECIRCGAIYQKGVDDAVEEKRGGGPGSSAGTTEQDTAEG